MKIFFRKFSITALYIISISLLFTSCLSGSLEENESEEDTPGTPSAPEVSSTVAADGILEAVTWNIEWYGSDANGPDDELKQTKNILQITDSLRADLYALQEISNQRSLDSLTKYMSGYKGFVANYINYNQRMAFLYNTEAIDSVSSGALTEGQDEYDWASGRFPLYFSFNYKYQGNIILIYALVIHGKANTGNSQEKEEAYNRRKRAAESLYAYLQSERPEVHILILGDFNDDVDVTIYNGISPSPYQDFLTNEESFRAVTKPISENGESSYLAGNYTDLIDHIIISDELFTNYSSGSAEIFKADSFIENYVSTTSDHLPVWAKFDLTKSK